MSSNMLHLLAPQKNSHVLYLYLLLSLILSKGIPPLHEVRQTQEVNHLSFPVDQSTEDRCISMTTRFVREKLYCYISVLLGLTLALFTRRLRFVHLH